MASQGLFDILAGAAGHPVNRPGLDAYVANSQANNGLRSAQTEEALVKAQSGVEQQEAKSQLEAAYRGMGLDPSKAHAASLISIAGLGDAKTALEAAQQSVARQTLGDANQLGQPTQTAAQQLLQGKVAEPVAVPDNYTTLPGAYQPNVQQTPEGAAVTAQHNAAADLSAAHAAHPEQFRSGYNVGELPPELQKAVAERRLDPLKLNSRNIGIISQLAKNDPNANFNQLHSDATLQNNATFHQRAMTLEALPEIMTNMVDAGKRIGYSDNRTVGHMQAWLRGEFNDPDYTEYMSQRNDALMNIANVMRGVGMSDQAHRAEIEASNPTLSPAALDAWLRGQLKNMQPRLNRTTHVSHMGEPGYGTPAAPGAAPAGQTPPPAAAPQGTAIPLDQYLKSKGF